MKISANEIKVGNILEFENKLWKVLKLEHTKPGKGGAYIQIEINLSFYFDLYRDGILRIQFYLCQYKLYQESEPFKG